MISGDKEREKRVGKLLNVAESLWNRRPRFNWVHPKMTLMQAHKFGKQILTMMTKEAYLAIESEKYDALQALNKINNFYDYENELGRILLGNNPSERSADRRKKTLIKFRYIEINSQYPFSMA